MAGIKFNLPIFSKFRIPDVVLLHMLIAVFTDDCFQAEIELWYDRDE